MTARERECVQYALESLQKAILNERIVRNRTETQAAYNEASSNIEMMQKQERLLRNRLKRKERHQRVVQ